MVTVALNGFGRIGKNFLRSLFNDENALQKIKLAAINCGPTDPQVVGHSFMYDSLLGTFKGSVSTNGNVLTINGHNITLYAETDISRINWNKHSIDWVVDASGKFTKREDAQKHIDSGAQRVLISAPSLDADVTIVLGVNGSDYTDQKIVSLGSCTTNAVAPILKCLDESYTLTSAYMMTIHSYTNNQLLLDGNNPDVRRSRSATLNMIPTTTGAMKVVDKVLPQLAGKIAGSALRVPTSRVSLIDLSFTAEESFTTESLNDLFLSVSKNKLQGVMEVATEPLVSSDFALNDHSIIVDKLLTTTIGSMGKVYGWYDNEWGYSCRLKDFLLQINA